MNNSYPIIIINNLKFNYTTNLLVRQCKFYNANRELYYLSPEVNIVSNAADLLYEHVYNGDLLKELNQLEPSSTLYTLCRQWFLLKSVMSIRKWDQCILNDVNNLVFDSFDNLISQTQGEAITIPNSEDGKFALCSFWTKSAVEKMCDFILELIKEKSNKFNKLKLSSSYYEMYQLLMTYFYHNENLVARPKKIMLCNYDKKISFRKKLNKLFLKKNNALSKVSCIYFNSKYNHKIHSFYNGSKLTIEKICSPFIALILNIKQYTRKRNGN